MDKFTLEDILAQKVLHLVADASADPEEFKAIVVGGFAVQSYIQEPELYRSTNDIDALTSTQLPRSGFRARFGDPMKERLGQQGYEVTTRKMQGGFEAATEEDGHPLMLHIIKYTPNAMERLPKIQQQIDDSVLLSVNELGGRELWVNRPEFVVGNKWMRMNYLLENGSGTQRQREFVQALKEGDFRTIGHSDLADLWQVAQRNRENVIDNYDHNSPDHRRGIVYDFQIAKDAYDVAVMTRALCDDRFEFDKDYFLDIVERN